MIDLQSFHARCSLDGCERAAASVLASLPLSDDDRTLLLEYGLPVGGEGRLVLNLRFASVRLVHRTGAIGLLPLQKRGSVSLLVSRLSGRVEPRSFVVIGEVVPVGSVASTGRHVCIDTDSGWVVWVRPNGNRPPGVMRFNSCLRAYLECMYAYVRFRVARDALHAQFDWKNEYPKVRPFAEALLELFAEDLKRIDPEGYEDQGAFWAYHVFNESILLGL